LISGIYIFTSNNTIIDIKNDISNSSSILLAASEVYFMKNIYEYIFFSYKTKV